jgi:hypothetical protein
MIPFRQLRVQLVGNVADEMTVKLSPAERVLDIRVYAGNGDGIRLSLRRFPLRAGN